MTAADFRRACAGQSIEERDFFSLSFDFFCLLHPCHCTLYGDPVREGLTVFVREEWKESLEVIYSSPCY